MVPLTHVLGQRLDLGPCLISAGARLCHEEFHRYPRVITVAKSAKTADRQGPCGVGPKR